MFGGETDRRMKCVFQMKKKPFYLSSTDQGMSRVRPVELNAHVELGGGHAAQH